MADVSYVPGLLTAVAGDQRWALVEASPDSPAVTRIWQQFAQGAAADALLVGLLADGVGGMPGFALLTTGTDGQHRLFCRGTVGATVVTMAAAGDLPSGDVRSRDVRSGDVRVGEGQVSSDRIDGAGLLTWREHVVARAARIFLGEPPADTAPRLPAASGVLLAGCVVIDFTNFATRETASYKPQMPEDRSGKAIGFLPDTITVRPPDGGLSQVPAPVAVGHAGPAGHEHGTAPASRIPVATAPVGQTFPAAPPSSAAESASGVNGAAGSPDGSTGTVDHGHLNDSPDGDGEYDFFWGTTQMRTIEGAAIRGPEDSGPPSSSQFARDGAPTASGPWTGGPADGLPGGPADGPPPGMPVNQSPPSRLWQEPDDPVQPGGMPPGPPGGLIDVPEWLAGPGGSAATVKRGDLPEPGAPAAPPDRIRPVVPALACPNGHLNPPNGAACRLCGVPLPHEPVSVPRPVLGVLRLSVGDVITLDRDVVMGRNPRTDYAGAADGDRPHVVKLPSTDSDVSRTHLRVTLDGWHVLVTDLNSTNGTLVTLPGSDPVQLRPGEPTPIQPGTVVTLAEGIDFRYEVSD